jgi:hypothetical protein
MSHVTLVGTRHFRHGRADLLKDGQPLTRFAQAEGCKLLISLSSRCLPQASAVKERRLRIQNHYRPVGATSGRNLEVITCQ